MPAPVTMCMPAAPWPGGVVGERLDQSGADAVTAEGRGQVDVQVGRELPAQLGEVGAEVGDVGEAVLQGGVLDGAHQVAGDGVVALDGQKQGVAATVQVAAEPALAECLALGAGREGARGGPEEDGVDLGQQSRCEPAGLDLFDLDCGVLHGRRP